MQGTKNQTRSALEISTLLNRSFTIGKAKKAIYAIKLRSPASVTNLNKPTDIAIPRKTIPFKTPSLKI